MQIVKEERGVKSLVMTTLIVNYGLRIIPYPNILIMGLISTFPSPSSMNHQEVTVINRLMDIMVILVLINIVIAVYMDIYIKSKFTSMRKSWEKTVREHISFLMEIDLVVIRQNFDIDKMIKQIGEQDEERNEEILGKLKA